MKAERGLNRPLSFCAFDFRFDRVRVRGVVAVRPFVHRAAKDQTGNRKAGPGRFDALPDRL